MPISVCKQQLFSWFKLDFQQRAEYHRCCGAELSVVIVGYILTSLQLQCEVQFVAAFKYAPGVLGSWWRCSKHMLLIYHSCQSSLICRCAFAGFDAQLSVHMSCLASTVPFNSRSNELLSLMCRRAQGPIETTCICPQLVCFESTRG
jgi:hypothetical protein